MNTDCCSGLPRPHPAKDPERDIHPLGPDQERQAHPAGDLIWIKYASLHISSPCFSAYALVGLKAATEDFFFFYFSLHLGIQLGQSGSWEVLISTQKPNQVDLYSAIPWLGPPAFLSLWWKDSRIPSVHDCFFPKLKILMKTLCPNPCPNSLDSSGKGQLGIWRGFFFFLSYSVFKSNSASLGTELFIFPLVKMRALAEHKCLFSFLECSCFCLWL